jgi:N-acetylglucosamine kinase-like BadF-type ATPase
MMDIIWKSPDDVPCEHLKRASKTQIHKISKHHLFSKNPLQVDGMEFRFHIDIKELIEYISRKPWLHDSQLAVHIESFGMEENSVGIVLLHEAKESEEEYKVRCMQYQRSKFKAAQALAALNESEEREVYERLKNKYGDK